MENNYRGILNDIQIERLAKEGMIEPFVPQKIREIDGVGALSFGLGHFGYDFRLGNTFKIFMGLSDDVIDPKDEVGMKELFEERTHYNQFLIPPHGFILAKTIEYIKMPQNVTCIALGKSTYARCALLANLTPFEAGWEGRVTLELTNPTNSSIRVYPREGIIQGLFLAGEPCNTPYDGKYQGQTGVTMGKV